MSVTLRQPLTLAECQLVREWRNDPVVLPMLRTGYKTEAEQEQFYRDVICNPESGHLYYAITKPAGARRMLGCGGLTYLHRKPGEAEISLILGPRERGQGFGARAVDVLLAQAWRIGLESVIGECYAGGPRGFWEAQFHRHSLESVTFSEDGSMRWRWVKP